MASNPQINDKGTIFELTITEADGVTIVDVSTALTKEVCFEKPDETLLTKTASFLTDGTDGIITYKTLAGDLDADGPWKIQAHVELSATEDFNSQVEAFVVDKNIC